MQDTLSGTDTIFQSPHLCPDEKFHGGMQVRKKVMDQAHRHPHRDFRKTAAVSVSRRCLFTLLLVTVTSRPSLQAENTEAGPSEFFRTTSLFELLEDKPTSKTSVPRTQLPSWDDQQARSASSVVSSPEFTAPQFSASQLSSSACCRPIHEVLPDGLLYRSYIASPS